MSCPLCGQSDTVFLHARDLNRRTTDDVFTYYRCAACHLIFMFPIPSDLAGCYPAKYHPVPSTLEQLEVEARREIYKIELVKRFVKYGRILDVGAGYGRFVYLAHKGGYKVDAIDVDRTCCEFIARVIGVHAIANADTKAALSGLDLYDVITFWHVVEHLADPWSALKEAVQKLKAGGFLIVAMPNPESLQFRVFRQYWAHLDAPRHLQLVPVHLIIRELTRDGGMQFVEATTSDRGSIDYNYLGWTWSMRNAIRLRGTWRIGGVLARTLGRFEQVGMRGSCYTAIFRKG